MGCLKLIFNIQIQIFNSNYQYMAREIKKEDVTRLWDLLFFTANNALKIHNYDDMLKTVQLAKEQTTKMFQDSDPVAEFNWIMIFFTEKYKIPEDLSNYTINPDPKVVELQIANFEQSRALFKYKTGRPTNKMDGYYEYLLAEKKKIELLAQKKEESIPQLNRNLTDYQRSKLFELLKTGEFIPYTTDNECFLWALGCDKMPEHWQPIKWNVAKQGLRELLTPILGTITNQHIRDIEKLFLDRKNNPFKMNKPTTSKDEVSARYGDICKIIENLNLD